MATPILVQMARLREEAWVVHRLNNFFFEIPYGDDQRAYHYRLPQIKRGIPEDDFLISLKTRMWKKDRWMSYFYPSLFRSSQYQIRRAGELENLYRTTKEHGYIEDVVTKEPYTGLASVTGIRVSALGSDIVHPMGFTEILLSKYPTWKVVIYSACTTLLSTAVLGVLAVRFILSH